jgi:tetratricopeptide (TPR) repeat protein
MSFDFNELEAVAAESITAGRFEDALRIYLFMADGDPSLDGGYLGGRIGTCYERLGELDAARYWYARAVEENPHVRTAEAEARKRLGDISISDLLAGGKHSFD